MSSIKRHYENEVHLIAQSLVRKVRRPKGQVGGLITTNTRRIRGGEKYKESK